MTRALPSLEAPDPDATCPECYERLYIVDYCAACGWRAPVCEASASDEVAEREQERQAAIRAEREKAIEAELAGVRVRARAWQLQQGAK